MNILQLSTTDRGGGAEKVARELFCSYRQRGHRSWLIVRDKFGDDPDVLVMPNDRYRTGAAQFWIRTGNRLSPLVGKVRGAGRLRELVQRVGEPARLRNVLAGHEDFAYPATWHLLELTPQLPHIVHCHNLHADLFDLQALPWLSQQVPVVLTLHDAWLLSGHCAHSFDCERWKTGCGRCPDLMIPPAVWRDATDFNWQRKKQVYAGSRLFVATPCRWLMQKVQESMLAPAIVEGRVIPYGLDLDVFRPGNQIHARASLEIPPEARVLLFAATKPRTNIWKDFRTLESAVAQLADRFHAERLLLICLGEQGTRQRIGRAEVWFAGFQTDPTLVARYLQAADLYLHAAKADTFPNTVLEALACGTPVVATAVGGIPEQVRDLNGYPQDQATGILTPPHDAAAMAGAIERLIIAPNLLRQLSQNAIADARCRFDVQQQATDYLNWFNEILASRPYSDRVSQR